MEFKLFYLERCPHCIKARKYMEELKNEYPEFQALELEMIEEQQQAELANQYDYYYVPTFFYGNEKLFEGSMTKEDVRNVFEKALERSR